MLPPLFKKMTFGKSPNLVVLNAPASFDPQLDEMKPITSVFRSVPPGEKVYFALVFVQTLEAIEKAVNTLEGHLGEDPQFWLAYPKGSSKKYTCEFNRDTGWQALGDAGYEPVRQIAIDDDWSALRFRQVSFIKHLNRSQGMALSVQGKDRTRKS